jgi:hypothetical protein
MGNPDIRITDAFLQSSAELMMTLARALAQAAAQNGVVDSDVREALSSLIQTYRTLQNGLIYEGLPPNPLAARLHRAVQEALNQFRQRETPRPGTSKTTDADLLRGLVFIERLALTCNNGRPRGRAFLDTLRSFQLEPADNLDTARSSLILP